MTLWHPDICDCQMRLGKDGEPVEFIVQCKAHDGKQPADVADECRAKERTREAIRAELALADAPDWQRGKDGGHEIILPEGLSKAQRDRVDAKVAEVGDARLTKVTTLSEIRERAEDARPVGKETPEERERREFFESPFPDSDWGTP